jgi:Helix-turn-helix domain
MNTTIKLAQGEPWTIAHNSIMFDGTLSMAARLLWLAYRSHAWSGNAVFPSRARLAEMVGCSVRTLDKANDELEERNLIERLSRFDADGGQKTSEVILHVPSATASEQAGEQCKKQHGGAQNLHGGSAGSAHGTRYTLTRSIDTEGLSIHNSPTGDRDDTPTSTQSALYRAYSTARHICGERFPASVLHDHKAELDFLIQSGVTADQVETATRNALARWTSPSRVTFRAVVRHLSALLEAESETAKRKTKAEAMADANAHGYDRARRMAIMGDGISFIVLSEQDQLAVVAGVPDETFGKLMSDMPSTLVEKFRVHRSVNRNVYARLE